jgi:hypothetical protein
MAKSYSVAEAVKVLAENKDHEAVMDITRRYPMVAVRAARIIGQAGNDFVEFMSFMPEYLSANKVNGSIKKSLFGDKDPETESEADDDSAEDEMPKPEKKSGRGRKKKEEVEEEAEGTEDTEDEEEESTSKYDGKSAMDLFKECKKRGIKAEPKKPSKFYIGLLEKDDAKKAAKKPAKKAEAEEDADTDDDGDDWDI